MAHQEVLLELPRLARLDECGRQVAEPGRHPVDDRAIGDEGVDDVARLLHPAARRLVELDPDPTASDGLDVSDRKVRARQDDGVGHDAEDSPLCSRPCSTS